MERSTTYIDNLIVAFHEGSISSEDLQYLRSWVNQETGNKHYFKQFQDSYLLSVVGAKSLKFNEDKAYSRFLDRVENEFEEAKDSSRIYDLRKIMSYAACAVVLLLLGIGSGYWFGVKKSSETLLTYTVEAPRAGKLKVDLPDGSSVWLNADSRLYYNNQFGITNRDVKLDGEGYFDIARNEKLPLTVNMIEGQVQVLGTRFNVQDYKENDEIRVSLLEGSVAFTNERNDKPILLEPNKQVVYNKKTGISTVKTIDAELSNAWISGNVLFNEERLGNIALVLERAFNIDIIFRNENLKNLVFYGDLTLEADNIKQIMDIMSATNKFSYSYSKEKKQVIIFN